MIIVIVDFVCNMTHFAKMHEAVLKAFIMVIYVKV